MRAQLSYTGAAVRPYGVLDYSNILAICGNGVRRPRVFHDNGFIGYAQRFLYGIHTGNRQSRQR